MTATEQPQSRRHEVPLRSEWDATLHYGLLDGGRSNERAGGARAGGARVFGRRRLREAAKLEELPDVFVGRDSHRRAIANAIANPRQRGTFLISGYRGAGKTSLLIQAARDAKPRLEKDGWTLLPLVLNVSEVSASLDRVGGDLGQDAGLQIDARRLLTALLRAIKNELGKSDLVDPSQHGRMRRPLAWFRPSSVKTNPYQKLYRDQVRPAYEKAVAAAYEETRRRQRATSEASTSERRVSIDVGNAFALFGSLALVAAGAVVVNAWLGGLQAAVAALAGVAVISFGWSMKETRSSSNSDEAGVVVTTDNSLHQLERDLRDILEGLGDLNLRTIIVLEELDKIEDRQGHQLDAVIRYFKNLFTQAPALFFFLTDKEYYDLVAESIRTAREERSYAIAHTFFTHRVFVGRPPTDVCLEYLKRIAAGGATVPGVDVIRRAHDERVRPPAAMTASEQFVRAVLFRSQDHLFDLKNELRRHVESDTDRPAFLVVDERLVDDSVILDASFHHLVERFAEDYRLTGQDYANEVLRDCLYAVFGARGASDPVPIENALPRARELSDQLTPEQERNIRDAVVNLVGALGAGGALDKVYDETDPTFRWRVSLKSAHFHPKRAPTDYERDHERVLDAIEADATQFGSRSLFGRTAASRQAEVLLARIADRRKEMADAENKTTLGRTEVVELQADLATRLDAVLASLCAAHLAQLAGRGMELSPVKETSTGGVWMLDGGRDPRKTNVGYLGAVLLAYGRPEETAGAIASIVNDQRIKRACVVAITFPPLTSVTYPQPGRSWTDAVQDLNLDSSWPVRLRTVPVDENLPSDGFEQWGAATAEELIFGDLWVNQAMFANADPTGSVEERWVLYADSGSQLGSHPNLATAVSEWWNAPERADVLVWSVADLRIEDVAQVFPLRLGDPPEDIVVIPTGFMTSPWVTGLTAASQQGLQSTLRSLVDATQQRVVLAIDETRVDPYRDLEHPVEAAGRTRRTMLTGDALPPEYASRSVVVLVRRGTRRGLFGEESAQARAGRILASTTPSAAEALYGQVAERELGACIELAALLTIRGADTAAQWRGKVIQFGDVDAMLALASRLAGSDRVEVLRSAAQLGSAEATYRLASGLRTSSPDEAESMRRRLLELPGSSDFLVKLAREEPDSNVSMELYERAAQDNQLDALQHLVSSTDGPQRIEYLTKLDRADPQGADVEALVRKIGDPALTTVVLEAAIDRGDSWNAIARLAVLESQNPGMVEEWFSRLVAEVEAGRLTVTASGFGDDPMTVKVLEYLAHRGNQSAMNGLVRHFERSDAGMALFWLELLEIGEDPSDVGALASWLDHGELQNRAYERLLEAGKYEVAVEYAEILLGQDDQQKARVVLEAAVQREVPDAADLLEKLGSDVTS